PHSSLGLRSRPLQPSSAPPGLPLEDDLNQPVLPEQVEFLVGERTRLRGPDITEPQPLPILAEKVPEPGPRGDVSADLSRAAALAIGPRPRTKPVSVVPIELPELSRHRRTVRRAQ